MKFAEKNRTVLVEEESTTDIKPKNIAPKVVPKPRATSSLKYIIIDSEVLLKSLKKTIRTVTPVFSVIKIPNKFHVLKSS